MYRVSQAKFLLDKYIAGLYCISALCADHEDLGGFGLIGINDDSMTRWLGSWWRWRRGRRIILFRGEVRK